MKRWDKRAWRNGQPLHHDSTTTINDLYEYETGELGNQIHVVENALYTYGHVLAKHTVWVCPTRQASRQYRGTPEQFYLSGTVILADNYDGYLVLQD